MKKVFLAVVVMLGMISLNAYSVLGYETDGISIEQGKTNGLSYITGGVGLEERAAMDRMVNHYNVRLIFATHSGAYLANVKVLVQNSNNRTLVDKKSNGPWFFVNLPKGQYKITAIHAGKKETREAALRKPYDVDVFHWRINIAKSK